jgi:hypothetical protein
MIACPTMAAPAFISSIVTVVKGTRFWGPTTSTKTFVELDSNEIKADDLKRF